MSSSPASFSASNGANYDPGLTQTYTGPINRVLTKSGEFNVRRTGLNWHDANPYTFLISTSWLSFWLVVGAAFVLINLAFAWTYLHIGASHIYGAAAPDPALQFLNLFFFSTHTLTTVGYGNMYPIGPVANAVAAFEALIGLMTFAVATGLLFGRFSRPSARFGFSSTMAVAPYRGGSSLQFRVVNRRKNNLIEVEAQMTLMTVELVNGRPQRRYDQLELERSKVLFLPLTWTVVHPINEKSPLSGKSAKDLEQLQAEVVVMMRGFDETFGQVVYARYSYRYDEFVWGVKFAAAFDVDSKGDLMLWVDKVGLTEPAPLPEVS